MGSQLKILLVEDEVIAAMFIESQLKSIGHKIISHVTTGEDAIISSKHNKPDLILMDIRLADSMDGIEAASIIQKESNIPIIFLTGYDEESIKEKAEKLNPIGYLIKPYQLKKLKEIIDTYFA